MKKSAKFVRGRTNREETCKVRKTNRTKDGEGEAYAPRPSEKLHGKEGEKKCVTKKNIAAGTPPSPKKRGQIL